MIYRSADQTSYILHEKARQFYGAGVGLFSIKTFSGGQALYNVGSGHFLTDDTSYLLLNHGQPYAITIDSAAPVESFCLFFAPGFADEVWRSLITGPEQLLAQPHCQPGASLTFFERTYPYNEALLTILNQLRQTLTSQPVEQGWLTEQLHRVMQQVLQVHTQLYQEMAALPAVRAATREELYRRLHLAREYLAATFAQPITLNEIAAVAGLSPNHLLRTFKQLFQQTPHQYLTHLRLAQAKKLLKQTDASVIDICLTVGFESTGTFSWLFRRRVGLSPTEYRRQKR